MKQSLVMFWILSFTLCSCSVHNAKHRDDQNLETLIANDSLIAKLATMQTDTLDCSADVYWEIIGKGKYIIPQLIESLTDTTPTNIYHGCKQENLNIGELSYFALEEIADFPTYVVTGIQFDTAVRKNGWVCWSFYDFLFEDKNKKFYQDKVKTFYEKSKFKFVKHPDSIITACMIKHSIKGKYDWRRKVSD